MAPSPHRPVDLSGNNCREKTGQERFFYDVGRFQVKDPMLLDEFHSLVDGCVQISAVQASAFARQVADDFNPLHDPDSKRFCVPGDLLFALVLRYYGLSERMHFSFRGMVGADLPLHFIDTDAEAFDIVDSAGKVYLHVRRSGAKTRNPEMVEAITRRYVAFSGRNFPHLLQPLLAEKQVMFNPDRPLVIYDSMAFSLSRLDAPEVQMELKSSQLDVEGKRGDAMLEFRIAAEGAAGLEIIGEGSKKLVVGSLRQYDEDRMQQVIAEFNRRKQVG